MALSANDKKRIDAMRQLRPMAEGERYKYTIKDLLVGGYLSVEGENLMLLESADYLDVKWSNFKKRKSEEEWTTELQCLSLKTGEIVWVEFEDTGDGINVYKTEKEVKLRELGVTRSDLEYISEEEEGIIVYNGKRFYYSDDETWAALYFRGDDETGVPVRFYEFEANDGTCLTIEMWYDDASDERPDREAFISSEVNLHDIEILQIGPVN